MLHRNRIWTIAPVADANTLAEQLTQITWCCCNGFRLGNYLFVNDATCPDGAQEYAVLKPRGDEYVQIESITFSWMNREQALDVIRRVLAGEFDHESYGRIESRRIQTPAEHGRCGHCA
jgi:hypothetical protein